MIEEKSFIENGTSWTFEDITIVFSEPKVVSVNNENLTLQDIFNGDCFFYYDTQVFYKDTEIWATMSWDFPNVHILPEAIERITSADIHSMHTVRKDECDHEDFYDDTYIVRHISETISDMFDIEHSWKIDRNNYYIKDSARPDGQYNDFFNILLEQDFACTAKFNREGQVTANSVFIKDVEKEDLLRLKSCAINFCELAYKKYLEKGKEE